MPTVYVIYDRADRAFVETTLLKPLPSLGFDRWISMWDAVDRGARAACAATIVVISKAAAESDPVRHEAGKCLKTPQPLVPVQLDQTDPENVARGLGSLPKVDPGDEITRAAVPLEKRVRATLPQLLPPVDTEPDASSPASGVPIEWNEEVLTEYLQQAMTGHDVNRGESLITSLARHLRQRPYPYPAKHARNDLKTLRRKRQFQLMGRYADMVLASGTDDLQVRRQLAQSLIERGRFDDALPVLEGIVKVAPPDDGERAEALGLIGRLFKQQYVNDPDSASAPEWLRRSFDAYYPVYRDGPDNFWHGVNSASVSLRGVRDGMTWASREQAQAIAGKIVKRLEELEAENGLQVWDLASRVEALVALNRFDEAGAALEQYLNHPDMDAFEVSSTFRQFDQVLQLADVPQGRSIYDRLMRAVDRYRAGGATSSAAQRVDVKDPDLLPIIIRVSDPAWEPGVDGIAISSRLGTVVSARATRPAIQALLKDPLVIAIEESRSVIDVDVHECARGLPFIKVDQNSSYTDNLGPFVERGRHALIAFVDNGIDVLHEAFTDDNKQTRIVGIWDQRDAAGPPPAKFDYGRHYTQSEIQGFVAAAAVPAALGRNDDGYPATQGHGTHVASIAAGRGVVPGFYGGVAPEARILVVIAKSDGDIGYSKAHLDALAFIESVASDLGAPVVVNVSKGMNAGAHDGKSLLEVGFDEFSGGGRKPGRVVVKSSGNERNQNGHAHFTVKTAERLRWTRKQQVVPWNFERIELWWSAADSLEFRLGSPAGAWSEWVSDAVPDVSGTLKPGGAFHLQLTKRHVDNGDSQLRIEIGDSLGVMPGTWTLEIVAASVKTAGTIHAWIGRGGGTASEFADFINQDVTLTIPATSQTVIAVAAVDADPKKAFLGEFSSRGPTRDGREKPDVTAPGVTVKAAMAGTANGGKISSGTSMAAPHVAGAIALVLSRAVELNRPWPGANQIRSALTQKTADFNGHFDPGQGYGIIDVAALLAAF
jgi:endonuclease G